MDNLSRLKMEVPESQIADDQLSIYLLEQSLSPTMEYVPDSKANQIGIYQAALSILNSIANSPVLMRSYKTDDITVSEFSDNIQSRIDQLDSKIRKLNAEFTRSQSKSNTFFLYGNY